MSKLRSALFRRKTRETNISIRMDLDGKGRACVRTPIGFLNHMLALLAGHGLFNLKIEASGDTDVDIHHTNEDVGICLGAALRKALGEKSGIKRFGFASVPMDEALAEVTLDLSGRPYLRVTGCGLRVTGRTKEYSINYLKQFLQALVNNAGITLHVEVISGEDLHHIIEAVFKALGRALKDAVTIDPRIEGILSTKGTL